MTQDVALNPHDFLKAAEDLIAAKGKPRQANLRRATSTAYYAVFHTLARCCADLMIGGKASDRSNHAWHQVYRALEHGVAKAACQNTSKLTKFPQEIQDFANAFVALQAKRHEADYDPNAFMKKSSCKIDVDLARNVIKDFERAALKDRRAFAALVLFKTPKK